MEKCETSVERHHDHRGRFSEGLLDKESILNALSIRPGQTIVDAGCGNGYMSREFSEKVGKSGKVYALDSDRYYIGLISRETQRTNIEAIEADITKPTDIHGGSVDLVYLSTVIHGFSERQAEDFLKEVKRILRPGGILAVVEIDKKETPFGPPLNIRYSPDELMGIVPMVPIDTLRVGEHFYMQMFRNSERREG